MLHIYPAQPLSQAPTASLYPGQITSSLLPARGGVGVVHMPTQVQALQAKVVSRLLEPEQLARKVFQNHHLGLAPQLQCLAYGASILFSTVSTQSLHLPARLNGYVTAFRALRPHRLLPVSAMHAEDVLNEPLFFNRQITVTINASAGSTAQKPLMPQEHTILLTAGITKVAHVQAALQLHQPQALLTCLQTVLLAMPAAWQTVASSAPAPATWQQGLSASGNQLIQNAQTGQLHAISPSQLLLPAQLQHISALCPVQVTPWDPSRPWRGPTAQLGSSAQSSNPLFTQGPLWGPHHLSLGVWGWGQQPAHQLVVRQVSQRLRLITTFGGKHPLATSGLTCPPRVLPRLGSVHTPTQALQEMESRWTASIQADPTGRVRRRSDIPDSQPAWMSPSSGPRLHWSQRQQQQQEQHQQQQQQLQHAQQLPSDKAAINDTLDVLEACGSHPQQSEWRRLWELASSRYFDRRHRVLWWRILHGSLMCGAYKTYIHRATPEQACCPFSCCSSLSQPQTISHLFLECPAAATVISWLCRLWHAMTGHMPQASVATILAATTAEGQCASEALLQTWHRLRLAVLHSIWAASQVAQHASATQSHPPASPAPSQPPAQLTSMLALKTVTAMVRQDWAKCNDDVRQVAGVCSSWLRGRDPSMTLESFQNLWCHNGVLASILAVPFHSGFV